MITFERLLNWAESYSEEDFLKACSKENRIEVRTGAILRINYATSDNDTLHSALVAFYRQQNLPLPAQSIFNFRFKNW